LNSEGKFDVLQAPASDELSAGEAVRFANAYAKQFVPLRYTYLEKTRGGSIDLKRLTACGRPLYAAAAFEPLPSDIDVAFRRPFGAWWMVTLCAGSEPQVSVAISALATDMKIETGAIRFPAFHGNEFVAVGIPVGHSGEFPLSPEVAVVRAAKLTGLRVKSVPELIMPAITEGAPQEAKWQMVLEAPAQLRTSKRGNVETDRVFSAVVVQRNGTPTSADYVANAEQPAGLEFQVPPILNLGESETSFEARYKAGIQTRFARRNPDRPIKFDIAEGRVTR